MSKKVHIIGSGFSSLSAAAYLAKAGYDVTVLEKNHYIGGRARQLKRDGFVFDMGPTFYWMPDVFESFFENFGKSPSDYYHLDKLNPAYRVYFEDSKHIDIADNPSEICETFEQEELGSGSRLNRFLNRARSNYEIAIQDLVYQPGERIWEIIKFKTAIRLNLFIKSIKAETSRIVKDKNLRQILQFPVLFLGAKPSNTPSFYNFMNHADFSLGTWHPQGGMFKVAEAMHKMAEELGVQFRTNSAVEKINITDDGRVSGVTVNGEYLSSDIVLSGADYHHTEKLIPPVFRQYSESYWAKKTFAPSALLFYVGFKKKLNKLKHHTLFFDTDFDEHAKEIYDTKQWPKNPLFYASFPSMSDPSMAPEGQECGTFLIPLAPGLEEKGEEAEHYFNLILNRVEASIGESLRESVLFVENFSISDFIEDYNSYKGNAYGLANTLLQTHILRPNLRSRKVENLYFTGQLTVPGPGVPPALISGKIVSELIVKYNPPTF